MGTKKLIEVDRASVINAWAYLMGLYLIWYFKSEGLLIKYSSELIEWKKYQDEKHFEVLIEKVIKNEMKKIQVTPEEIKEIVDKVVKKPTFKIIYSVDLLNSPVCPLPLRY